MKNNLLAYLALAAICLIWGTTYLALRVAALNFPPFLFTTIRQVSAGIILLAVMFTIGRAAWPSRELLIRQAIGGFFMISLGNGLVAWAETYVPSGIAAVLCSLMPVVVIIINLTVNREERPTIPILIGIALGFVGIVMIFGQNVNELSNLEYLVSILLIFTAVLCWAGGSVWIKKKNTNSNPFVNAGLQMFFGGIWMIPFSIVFDDFSKLHWSLEAFYSLLYLTIVGSLIAYTCFSYALRKLPMTIVSLYAYINPIVAVLLGWLILDEKLNLQIGVAILITVAGIYIVNRGYQLRDLWKAQVSTK